MTIYVISPLLYEDSKVHLHVFIKIVDFNLSCRFSLQEETIITKFTPCLCTFTHKPGLRAAAVDLRLLTSS